MIDLKMDEIFINLFSTSSLENSCERLHNLHPQENWVPVPVWSERRNILKGKGTTEKLPRNSAQWHLRAAVFETVHPMVNNDEEHRDEQGFSVLPTMIIH